MMQNSMTYKGYHGSVEICPGDNILFGQVLFISPLINYEAETAKGLEQAFQEAINAYLVDCAQQDIQPEKPCKGSLNVRLGHDLHLAASIAAFQASTSTNEFIKRAVQKSVGL
ncbi:type II toxin-antitoxin system HicB family antitoxin [Shewanella sp. SNU WT4]|uniref:type II toxin-antitoxin system HicB family antitoxin n=1 Tax=Shewanella sp. SNU WT4 TaxID=2590015 RepID=UPI001F0FC4E3|nr:type II toxin-antitoxin system HicB family antitoxin [Shewanella sp. SNU WT4]